MEALRNGRRKVRLAVLGSGEGSNYEAISGAIRRGELWAEVRLAISDVPDSRILKRARSHGVPAIFADPGSSRARLSPEAESDIVSRLNAAEVDLVILAGFMRIIGSVLLEAYPSRVLNLHPSLLPAFPGLNAPQQALESGASESGCTVHLVTPELDAGPILGQARIPILPEDDAAKLQARIQRQEHELLPRIIAEYGARLLDEDRKSKEAEQSFINS